MSPLCSLPGACMVWIQWSVPKSSVTLVGFSQWGVPVRKMKQEESKLSQGIYPPSSLPKRSHWVGCNPQQEIPIFLGATNCTESYSLWSWQIFPLLTLSSGEPQLHRFLVGTLADTFWIKICMFLNCSSYFPWSRNHPEKQDSLWSYISGIKAFLLHLRAWQTFSIKGR